MAIYLGHTTAQRVLESRLALALDFDPVVGPTNCVTNKRDVRAILNALPRQDGYEGVDPLFFLRAHEPLDLVVANEAERRRWSGASCHIFPDGADRRAFLQLAEDVLVACPELCLLQRASELSLIETIKLAMSFCGIYRLVGDTTTRMIFDRRPVMTVDGAASYISRARAPKGKGALGVKRALQALHYVLPYSGSPLETRMVLPFCLDKRLGGFGLPRPEMNKAIPLRGRAPTILGTEMVAGDAVWSDARLVFEAQSKEHHDDEARYGEDYARQLALESMGYKVVFVTKYQLDDLNQVNELARIIARRTCRPLDEADYEKTPLRRAMMREILA